MNKNHTIQLEDFHTLAEEKKRRRRARDGLYVSRLFPVGLPTGTLAQLARRRPGKLDWSRVELIACAAHLPLCAGSLLKCRERFFAVLDWTEVEDSVAKPCAARESGEPARPARTAGENNGPMSNPAPHQLLPSLPKLASLPSHCRKKTGKGHISSDRLRQISLFATTSSLPYA